MLSCVQVRLRNKITYLLRRMLKKVGKKIGRHVGDKGGSNRHEKRATAAAGCFLHSGGQATSSDSRKVGEGLFDGKERHDACGSVVEALFLGEMKERRFERKIQGERRRILKLRILIGCSSKIGRVLLGNVYLPQKCRRVRIFAPQCLTSFFLVVTLNNYKKGERWEELRIVSEPERYRTDDTCTEKYLAQDPKGPSPPSCARPQLSSNQLSGKLVSRARYGGNLSALPKRDARWQSSQQKLAPSFFEMTTKRRNPMTLFLSTDASMMCSSFMMVVTYLFAISFFLKFSTSLLGCTTKQVVVIRPSSCAGTLHMIGPLAGVCSDKGMSASDCATTRGNQKRI